MDSGKAPTTVRKMKKKQVKDELERIKQAEKKKRRLEKALATSAAIISELEKKKQEKEKQQRLDEEGAAIAEAVALQVLIGEDSNDACSRVSYGRQVYSNPNKEFGWIVNEHGGSICGWNRYAYGESGSFVGGVEGPRGDEVSAAGLTVSGLQIADDEDMNAFVFKRTVKG